MSDTQSPCKRYTILFFACMLTFGSYYVFDLPSAIQKDLEDYLLIDDSQYQLFYTCYTICNFLSVVFGGYLLDRTGARLGAIVFTGFICVGQLIFGIGGQCKSYATMLAGRCVYGLGGGSICVCQEAITTHYFKGKELALAFGATLCVSRLGSVLNFFISPPICTAIGVPSTIWFSVSICFLSIIFVSIFFYLDLQHERQTHKQMKAKTKKINLKDLLTFKAEYWLLCAICAVFYGCIFPFIAVASKLFIDKWHFERWNASVCTGIVYDVALVISLPMGKLVDHIGNRLTFLITATMITVAANVTLLCTSENDGWAPWFSMVLMGFAYCFTASTLWSGVSLVVRKAQVGSAMAIITAIQMLFNSIINVVIGQLKQQTDKMYVFVGQAIVSALLVIILGLLDMKRYKILNNKESVGIFKDHIDEPAPVEDQEQEKLIQPEDEQKETVQVDEK